MIQDGPVDRGDVPEAHFVAPADQHDAPSADLAADVAADNESAPSGILGELAEGSSPVVEDEAERQIDIEDAVASITDTDTQTQMTLPTHEASSATPSDETAQDDAFILSAPILAEGDGILAPADPIPSSRPSIIKQISGLWRARPTAEDAQEDAVKPSQEDDEPAILNLSRGSALQESLPIGNQSHNEPDEADDELDIPAFLRRQAN